MSAPELLVVLPRGRGSGERLTATLREAIDSARLVGGTRLPSSRRLAADLEVSRGVVVRAYEQLVAEGRLLSRPGSGTVVAPHGGDPPRAQPSRRAGPGGPAPLRPGVPDLGMFPRSAWRRAYEQALRTAEDSLLDYGDPVGLPALREELAAYLGRVRAARVRADHVIVTTGAAQAMSLVARVVRSRGLSEIAMEDPGSLAVGEQFVAHGLRLVGIPVDEHGIDVSALRRSDVRAVFVTPAHQFPLGVVLAPDRRAGLVRWARESGGLILEDDYDAEFRYDREPVGCLQGLAPDVVGLIGSASKALAPALRRGWLVAPPAWRDELAAAKQIADMGGSALEQLAFAHFVGGGGYDRHLRHVRRAQRRRRDVLVAALDEHVPGVRISGIAAGLHLVAHLPDGIDDVRVTDRARLAGLGPLALSSLRLSSTGPPGLVLGYAAHAPDQLRAAIRRLSTVVKGAA